MKNLRKYVISSLVTLLGIAGCGKPVVETKAQERPNIQRTEYMDGYAVIQYSPYRHFKHNSLRNFDRLVIGKGVFGIEYRDNGCDEDVDEITSLDVYKKGEPGTEVLFHKANVELMTIKRELGIEK